MKRANTYVKFGLIVFLLSFSLIAVAQNPYPKTGDQAVCLNATEPYGVTDIPTSTFNWAITSGTAGTDWIMTNTGHNTITVKWLKVGTYTMQVVETNANGCSGDPTTINITVVSVPVVTITNPSAVCAPATVDLTASSITTGSTAGLTFTYYTDPAATNVLANPNAVTTSGTYYIKGATAGGCFDIKPVTVSINSTPAPSISGPASVCESVNNNTETYSTADVSGHTYAWTITGGTIVSGQGTNQITVKWTTAGTGNVSVLETITSSGCSKSDSKTITVTAKPTTSPITHN
jgi:hypothetical protein